MTLQVRTELDPQTRHQIELEIARHRSLEDVVRWALGSIPPLTICEIVTQDEYTHDVIVAYRGGLYLVYDTT